MTMLSGAQSPDATKAPPGRRDESVGQLASQLGEQVSRLVRDELALAQVEAKQRAKRVGAGAGMFGAAGLIGFFGLSCMVTAAVLGLANVLQPWLAAVVVGLALFLVAGLTVLPGWKGITAKHPDVPGDSIQSVKADVDAVRSALHHNGTGEAR